VKKGDHVMVRSKFSYFYGVTGVIEAILNVNLFPYIVVFDKPFTGDGNICIKEVCYDEDELEVIE
jgi:hypothetical protein